MSEFDIFVSSLSIFTLDHMKNLENTTLDRSTGHFHEEFDLAGSEDFEESKFWHHEFLYSFLRHLPDDRRTICDDFPALVMVICDVFYSHFSAVPMFKISVRKLPALLSSWRPWAYAPWTRRPYELVIKTGLGRQTTTVTCRGGSRLCCSEDRRVPTECSSWTS